MAKRAGLHAVAVAMFGLAGAPALADNCATLHPGGRLGPHPDFTSWPYGRACVVLWPNRRGRVIEGPQREAQCNATPGMRRYLPDTGSNYFVCIYDEPQQQAERDPPGATRTDDPPPLPPQQRPEPEPEPPRAPDPPPPSRYGSGGGTFSAPQLGTRPSGGLAQPPSGGTFSAPRLGQRPDGGIAGSDRPVEGSRRQSGTCPPDPSRCIASEQVRRSGSQVIYRFVQSCDKTLITFDYEDCDGPNRCKTTTYRNMAQSTSFDLYNYRDKPEPKNVRCAPTR